MFAHEVQAIYETPQGLDKEKKKLNLLDSGDGDD